MNKPNQILITEIPRSGAGIITGALVKAGLFAGECNKLFQNYKISTLLQNSLVQAGYDGSGVYPIPIDIPQDDNVLFREKVNSLMGSENWVIQDARLLLNQEVWCKAFPDALWIVVTRDVEGIIQSCKRTAWMNTFKDPLYRQRLGLQSETEGWLLMVTHYQKCLLNLYNSAPHVLSINPERLISDDYEELRGLYNLLELQWSKDVIEYMNSKFDKAKKGCNNEDNNRSR